MRSNFYKHSCCQDNEASLSQGSRLVSVEVPNGLENLCGHFTATHFIPLSRESRPRHVCRIRKEIFPFRSPRCLSKVLVLRLFKTPADLDLGLPHRSSLSRFNPTILSRLEATNTVFLLWQYRYYQILKVSPALNVDRGCYLLLKRERQHYRHLISGMACLKGEA